MILLVLYDGTIPLGKPASVVGAHRTLFAVDPALLAFQVPRFVASELSAANTLPDACLLIRFTLLDLVTVLHRHRRQSQSRHRNKTKNHF
jgi:hypothetical protein